MRGKLVVLVGILAAGCTTVADYYPNSKVVTVDGVEYMVRPLSAANSWQAVMNKPTGASLMVIDPNLYVNNVRAIEKATGCRVQRESVQNRDNNTIAAVRC